MKMLTNTRKLFARTCKLALLSAISVAFINQASAQCLVGSLKINTGYNPVTNTTIAPGVGNQDPNWYVSSLTTDLVPIAAPNTPNYQAYVVSTALDWLNAPNSGWLNIIASNTYTTVGTGTYQATFSRNFTVCKEDDINFSLQIANDNYCPGIRVDGNPVPPAAPFSQPAVFSISNYSTFTTIPTFTMHLTPGVHTIDVDVVNLPVWASNPHGLNMAGSVSSATGINSLVSPGCTQFSCETCHPDFTYSVYSGTPYTYYFAAEDLSYSSYVWTLNGTTVATTSTFGYNFPGPGSYTVCLIATDPATGRSCRKCLLVCISDNGKPTNPAGPVKREINNPNPLAAKTEMNISKVYPNPTSAELNVEFTTVKDNDVNIKLYDLSGKLLIEQNKFMTAGDQKVILNTAKLAGGIYMLQVSDGTKTVNQQVIKQ